MSIRRLRLLFAAYGIALGFLLPWNVPLLHARGLSVESIGLVLGLAAFASLVCVPAWGVIADTVLGRDRALMVTSILASLCGAGILLSGGQPVASAISVIGAITFVAPWAPVSDALALATLGNHPRAYGRLRIWTSAGWIVSVLLAGVTYTLVGPPAVTALFVVASLAVTVALAIRRPRHALLRRPERGMGARLDRHALWAALRVSPVFLPFLGVLLVSSVATNAAYAFISLRIIDEGGGAMLIALASALPAVAEIPVFASIGRLADRWGLRVLFAAGCLVSAMQLLVVALVPSAAIITLVRVVDGVGFALRYSSIVLIAGAALPDRLKATGQSAAWLVMGGIAPIIAAPLGGLIYGTLGGAALFATCATLLCSAAALAWLVLASLAQGRRPGETPRPEPVTAE